MPYFSLMVILKDKATGGEHIGIPMRAAEEVLKQSHNGRRGSSPSPFAMEEAKQGQHQKA